MEIGGFDMPPLRVARSIYEPGLVLEVVRDFWPDGVYQGGDEETTHPLAVLAADVGDEFFVYRDAASAADWAAQGASESNGNQMLHFIIQSKAADEVEVYLIVGALTTETALLYGALGEAFAASTSRQALEAGLRATGGALTWPEFSAAVGRARHELYPDWSRDELARHPHDALQFCAAVRAKLQTPVPDPLIMRALLPPRHHGQLSRR